MSNTQIPGASVWHQRVYDHIVQHVDSEMDVIRSYQARANNSESPAFAYLAKLILDDERRHHQMLRDLAETIKTSAELTGEPTPIPNLAMFGEDHEQILEDTERYLALEKADNKELDALVKDLGDVRNTTLWELVVRLIQLDNEKHQRILRFIRDRAREAS